MSDRLPEPSRFDTTGLVERASATPTRRTAAQPIRREEPGTAAKRPAAPVPRSLRDVQGWMLEAVTAHASDDVEAVVTAGPRLAASARLGVYQSAYHARLVECLADDYPVVLAALGEERFEPEET